MQQVLSENGRKRIEIKKNISTLAKNLKTTTMKKLLLLSFAALGFATHAQVIYSNDFTAAAGLTVIDGDGDAKQWGLYTGSATTAGWGLTGNFAGSKSWDSAAGALTPNNFLLTPEIVIPDTFDPITLSFRLGSTDLTFFAEQISVYLAPSTANTAALIAELTPVFNLTLESDNARTAILQTVDVSSYAGQTVKIVMRHHDCTDQNLLYFDDLKLEIAPLANEIFAKTSFETYPNPATNVVNISSKNNGINSVVMTDVNGRTVKNVNIASATEAQINISDLAAGVYMMKITSNEGTTTKKIIKE